MDPDGRDELSPDEERIAREREFSRRQLLRAGAMVPVIGGVGYILAACGGGGHSDKAKKTTTHGDHTDASQASTTHSDHSDSAHNDTSHSDSAHTDTAHTDTTHTDAHNDHADTHTDTHTDTHSDGHSDRVHGDTGLHVDTPHGDGGLTFHTDSHGDHTDSTGPIRHDDRHQDTPAHSDHIDKPHGDRTQPVAKQ